MKCLLCFWSLLTPEKNIWFCNYYILHHVHHLVSQLRASELELTRKSNKPKYKEIICLSITINKHFYSSCQTNWLQVVGSYCSSVIYQIYLSTECKIILYTKIKNLSTG